MVEVVRSQTLHQGWGRYMALTIRLPDGTEVVRELEDHGRAAAVLPYDPARRVALMVRLLRAGPLWAGADPFVLEAPAGMVEDGEDPADCVRREAEEEVGIRLQALDPVAEAWSSPGVSAESIALYLAPFGEDGRVGSGGGVAEEHEGIEVVEAPLTEVWTSLERGEIRDMKTLVLVYALKARRPELFS